MKITIKITILSSTISSVYSQCKLVCRFKFSSSFQQDGFRLCANVFIVHQMDKIILKVIPTISFLCAFIVIAVVWTLLFFNIENDFYNYIFIIMVIVLGVNGPLEAEIGRGPDIPERVFQLAFIWNSCLLCKKNEHWANERHETWKSVAYDNSKLYSLASWQQYACTIRFKYSRKQRLIYFFRYIYLILHVKICAAICKLYGSCFRSH